MWTIGVIGGVGSGKSTVTEYLRELGSCVISADRIAHEVIKLPEICDQMHARWVASKKLSFNEVFDDSSWPNITPNRKRIGRFVFQNPDELEFLEDLMHPLIHERINQSYKRYNQAYTTAVVLDIPLLKRQYYAYCQHILFVDADEDVRVVRYGNRQTSLERCFFYNKDNVPDEIRKDLQARDKHMGLSVTWKTRDKVRVIDNNGCIKNTFDQTRDFWNKYILQGGDADVGSTDVGAVERNS